MTEEETEEILRRALQGLSERERTVLALYYYEDLKMAEIGEVLDITESRVSQIHATALARLRTSITEAQR